MGQLQLRNVGKAYKRYPRKAGRLLEWLGAEKQHELRWVLRDITLDIAAGESIGIVGSNGAGKSTLLKIITGTAMPTTGAVQAGGTVSALLELGLGFHPDFTGRENVYMAGSIRGLTPEAIAALMPHIEAFAEIGDYLDQPVRTYSSGMQVRLAFSVATAVRPDILIVDEALSVGDIYFQQKCFERIRGFRDEGTTLLFVSHSMHTVYALCARAIYLEEGVLRLDGPAKEVIDLYQAHVVAKSHKGEEEVVVVAPNDSSSAASAEEPGATTGSYRSEGVRIRSVRLLDAAGRARDVFLGDQEMVVEIVGVFDKKVDDPHFGFQVRDRFGQPLFMTTTHGLGARIGVLQPGDTRTIRFRFMPSIAPGEYTVTAGIANRGRFDGSFEEALVRHQDVAAFTVIEAANAKRWAGMINLKPTVEVAGAGQSA